MTNNTLLLTNGFNILIDRFGNTSPTLTPISKFRLSINTPDVTYGDTTLTTQIPISGTEMIDACNVTTGWTTTGGTVTVNATTFKPDGVTDGSLNFTKTGTASADLSTTKATTSLNGTSKDFIMWFYVKDATTLAKLTTSGTALIIRYGTDSSNYYRKDILQSSLATGWNYITSAITSGFTTTVGTPTLATMNYTLIQTSATTATDTWSAGDIIFDSLRLASADDYLKTQDSVTTSNTDNSVTYVNKLTVAEANGFLINGLGLVNTDGTELLAIKSKFPNNSKDTTDLFKFTTKIRFSNI